MADSLKSRQEYIRAAKDVPCADCGVKYRYYIMDFDHRPGIRKLYTISALARRCPGGMKTLIAEIAKCDVVCANCHRERTQQRLWGKKGKRKKQ